VLAVNGVAFRAMTARCHTLEHAAYCDEVAAEIARLVALAAEADPAAACTTCPGWDMAKLFDHVGGVHRWAGAMVRDLAKERLDQRAIGRTRAEGAAHAPWLAEGGEGLVAALRGADPGAAMWSWGSDPHARFWARRMLHETLVHRADAEMSLGRAPVIDARVAADGVDEYLDNLARAVYFAPNVAKLRGNGERVALESEDASWIVTLNPDDFEWAHDGGEAAVRVRARASDMLLFAYGRIAPDDARIEVEGDRALLGFWVENSSI
jgi:uncharacterized protein (TIGR03083 family)